MSQIFHFALALLLVKGVHEHSINPVNIINYEELSRNNFEILSKNKQFILIIYSKDNPGSNQQVDSLVDEFKKSVDRLSKRDKNVLINIMIQDERVAAKYNLHIFPQLLFLRSGRRVALNGKTTSLKLLEEWFEAHQQKSTFELNDASFELNTKAYAGSLISFKHFC